MELGQSSSPQNQMKVTALAFHGIVRTHSFALFSSRQLFNLILISIYLSKSMATLLGRTIQLTTQCPADYPSTAKDVSQDTMQIRRLGVRYVCFVKESIEHWFKGQGPVKSILILFYRNRKCFWYETYLNLTTFNLNIYMPHTYMNLLYEPKVRIENS